MPPIQDDQTDVQALCRDVREIEQRLDPGELAFLAKAQRDARGYAMREHERESTRDVGEDDPVVERVHRAEASFWRRAP